MAEACEWAAAKLLLLLVMLLMLLLPMQQLWCLPTWSMNLRSADCLPQRQQWRLVHADARALLLLLLLLGNGSCWMPPAQVAMSPGHTWLTPPRQLSLALPSLTLTLLPSRLMATKLGRPSCSCCATA